MKAFFLRNLLLAGVIVMGMSGSAHAAIIERTFDIDASRFVQVFGFDPTNPQDPVHLNFTLNFDNSADIATTTSGLTINAFNLPYSAEFQYFAATDALALATDLTDPGTCSSLASTFCVFIHDLTSGAPDLVFFQQSTPSTNVWRAEQLSLTFTDAPGRGAVPEPATWALMILGFGTAGMFLRKRRNIALAA